MSLSNVHMYLVPVLHLGKTCQRFLATIHPLAEDSIPSSLLSWITTDARPDAIIVVEDGAPEVHLLSDKSQQGTLTFEHFKSSFMRYTCTLFGHLNAFVI